MNAVTRRGGDRIVTIKAESENYARWLHTIGKGIMQGEGIRRWVWSVRRMIFCEFCDRESANLIARDREWHYLCMVYENKSDENEKFKHDNGRRMKVCH